MRKMGLTCEVEKQSPASPQRENGNAWERWWLELLEADIPILPDLVLCAEENFPKERGRDGGVGSPAGGGEGRKEGDGR